MIVFTDDAWPDGEERIYLVWDHIEVSGLYLNLRRKVRTHELMDKYR